MKLIIIIVDESRVVVVVSKDCDAESVEGLSRHTTGVERVFRIVTNANPNPGFTNFFWGEEFKTYPQVIKEVRSSCSAGAVVD